MSPAPILPGIELLDGTEPVVVYAPHGGRRLRPVRRGDSVNDLHTAEIARELAQRLGAHALINHSIDRNDADLNRVGVLTTDSLGVLAELRALVERCAAGGATPLVLLVHGWNVTLPACDVGVGLVERDGRLSGAHVTVSRSTFDGFVRHVARELLSCGIEAPIGRRYPAGARDNATQLFSGRHCGHESPDAAALSALARDGAVDAVQLELAIPLRWPGRYREAFLDAAEAAVRTHVGAHARSVHARSPADSGAVSPAVRTPRSEWDAGRQSYDSRAPIPAGWSLQAVLPDGAGLFAGVEPTGPHDAAARLCLVKRDGRMLLFVGEGSWEGDETRHAIGGFELEAEAGAKAHRGRRVCVRYRGPMVVYPSHDAFCDLEEGLAGAELTDAQAELMIEAGEGNTGNLRGYLRTDDTLLELDCAAVCERGSRRGAAGSGGSRVMVATPPDAFSAAGAQRAEVLEWQTDGAGEIREIALELADGRAATARVLTRVPVYRVTAKEVVVKVTFGTAAVAPRDVPAGRASTEDALALFERIEIVSSGPTSA